MPRAVCADCGSKLSRGHCPACGVAGRGARPARPIRASDPDDDPPPAGRGMGPVWVVSAGLGGLLLGGLIIGGAVLLRDERRGLPPPNPPNRPVAEKKPEPPAKAAEPKDKAKAPAGVNPAARPPLAWTPFRGPDGAFAVDFPNGEPTKGTSPLAAAGDAATWTRADGDRTYTVTTLTLDAIFGGTGLGDDLTGALGVGGEATDVRVGGHPGKQTVARLGGRTAVQQVVKVRQTTYLFAVEGPADLTPADVDVGRFFAGVRIPAGK